MSPKVKDRIITGLIAAASGSTVALLAFWLNTSEVNAKELNDAIDNKLDKSEYQKDQTLRWSQHDKIHQAEGKTIENMVDKIDWLYMNEISKKNYTVPPLRDSQ